VTRLRVLSAGAAQSVTECIAAQFTSETGCAVEAAYGAVGAIKARILEGEPADVIILTAALIDELVVSGYIAPESRCDLGIVGTGVAVRAGTPLPDVTSSGALCGTLLASNRIICPDPAVATAGKVVMRALDLLGIHEQVRARLHFFPNGHASMQELARSRHALDMGITQNTEILANNGVTYVGPLPDELQMKTIYAGGLAAKTQDPVLSGNFIERFATPSARAMLKTAGYELDQ
jgi:molybdate transport system substrate-binding protein